MRKFLEEKYVEFGGPDGGDGGNGGNIVFKGARNRNTLIDFLGFNNVLKPKRK